MVRARSVLAHGDLSVKYVSPAGPAVLLFSARAGGPAWTVERRGGRGGYGPVCLCVCACVFVCGRGVGKGNGQ